RSLVASRRLCDTEALATSSQLTNLPRPRSAQTFVKAEVNVVLPWSTCPIVPMFTCGLRRSYFAFAITSPYLPVQSVKYLRYCISATFDRRSGSSKPTGTGPVLAGLGWAGV